MTMLIRLRTLIVCTLTVGSLSLSTALAGDWPQWRGPNHDGKSDESGFKTNWKGQLEPVWEARIGSGYSGIAVVGSLVYTCGVADGGDILFCMD